MQALRFAGTPMILRQPLLIGIGIAFLLALLATHYEPDAAPTGGYGWLVGAGLMIGCLALAAWFLCAWEEVLVDPGAREVTRIHWFLGRALVREQSPFSCFCGVQVRQHTITRHEAATSPGSGGYKAGSRATHSHRHVLSLLRADSALAGPGQSLSIPHHPLELPTDLAHDPLALEAMALELSRLGPWPARRSGYVLVSGVEESQTDGAPSRSRATRPFHGESVIEGAQEMRDATRTAAGQPPG